ncbi:MAG: hypothetical protein WBO46_02545 [Caldilineaceae bacterium]
MTIHSFADVLRHLSPPVCVVERLAAQEASLCVDATNFLARWHALRRGEPLAELDAWLAREYGPASGPRPSPDTAQGSGAEGRLPQAARTSDAPDGTASSHQAYGPGGKGAGLLSQQEPPMAERYEEGGLL